MHHVMAPRDQGSGRDTWPLRHKTKAETLIEIGRQGIKIQMWGMSPRRRRSSKLEDKELRSRCGACGQSIAEMMVGEGNNLFDILE